MVTAYDGDRALRYVENEARIAWTALQRERKELNRLVALQRGDTFTNWLIEGKRKSAELAKALLHEHLEVRRVLNGKKATGER